MNKHLPLLLFIGLAWGQKEYMTTNLVKQNGVFKKKFSDEIANGAVFKMISGNKVKLGNMKDGKPNGNWKYWSDDGLKSSERVYEKGILTQLTSYRSDGTEFYSCTFKNHKIYNGTILLTIQVKEGPFLLPKPIFLKFYEGLPVTRTWTDSVDGKFVEGQIEDCTKIKCIDDELPSFESWSPFDG